MRRSRSIEASIPEGFGIEFAKAILCARTVQVEDNGLTGPGLGGHRGQEAAAGRLDDVRVKPMAGCDRGNGLDGLQAEVEGRAGHVRPGSNINGSPGFAGVQRGLDFGVGARETFGLGVANRRLVNGGVGMDGVDIRPDDEEWIRQQGGQRSTRGGVALQQRPLGGGRERRRVEARDGLLFGRVEGADGFER